MISEPPKPPDEPTEPDVDEVITEAGGDVRAAIRMLLRDVMTLAADADANVSRGYVRARF